MFVIADSLPLDNDFIYYEIGGGELSKSPSGSQVITASLKASNDFSLNYSCGKFDPNLDFSHLIEGTEGYIHKFMEQIDIAAKGTLASLPLLILQRINPGLYDQVQNILLRAEAAIQVANKSCEDYQNAIVAGDNPFDGFVTMSTGQQWKKKMGSGVGLSLITTMREIADSVGEPGVPSIGGKSKGGKNDPPIEMIKDVTTAGWHMLRGGKTGISSNGVMPPESYLIEVFPSVSSVETFVTQVVGNISVTTNDQGDVKKGQGGAGIMPLKNEARDKVETEITNLISNCPSACTRSNLDKASAPGIKITRDLIDILKSLDFVTKVLIKSGYLTKLQH